MSYIYPAIFTKAGDDYVVSFPDLPGCATEGHGVSHAFDMALDALDLFLSVLLDEKEELPQASDPLDIQLDSDSFVSLVSVEAAQRRDSTPVKRTLSLPKWMDAEARDQGLSLSRVLQDALADRFTNHG